NKRTSFTLDALDRQVAIRHANGARVTHGFDAAGQEVRLSNFRGNGTLLNRFTYTYDPRGRRTAARQANPDRTPWTYDPAHQLRHEVRSGATSFDVTHVYDAAGNRTVQIDAGVRTTYTVDAANQLTLALTGTARTTYTHDACGNRTRKDAPAALTL